MHISRALVLGLTLIAASAHAQGIVQARSDVPAEVVLNGQLMGVTPLDIAALQPGLHEVRLQAIGRDQHRTYSISVPADVASQSHIQGQFGALVVRPVVIERPCIAAPAHAVAVVRNRGLKRGHYKRGYYRRRF